MPTLPEFDLESQPLEQASDDADLTLIVTAHPSVDHDTIAQHAFHVRTLCYQLRPIDTYPDPTQSTRPRRHVRVDRQTQ